jgi:hypothetical protein
VQQARLALKVHRAQLEQQVLLVRLAPKVHRAQLEQLER